MISFSTSFCVENNCFAFSIYSTYASKLKVNFSALEKVSTNSQCFIKIVAKSKL